MSNNEEINIQNAKSEFKATLHDDAFHGPIGKFVKFVHSYPCEADEVAIQVQCLVAFGNMVGRTPNLSVGPSRVYCNEFVSIVGSSAKARKGTALSYVTELLDPIDAEHLLNCRDSNLQSGEGLVRRVTDGNSHHSPVIDKRLLVIASELAGPLTAMSRPGSNLSVILRDAWDGKPLSNPTKENADKSTGHHISIIGHITNHELQELLSENNKQNGFANRFLWFYVQRKAVVSFPETFTDQQLEPFRDQIARALHFGKQQQQFRFSDDAKAFWDSEYQRLESEPDTELDGITSRSAPHVLRFSLIYSVLDCSATIEVAHLRAGLAIWAYALESTKFIFNQSGLDETALRLLSTINCCPGVKKTQFYKVFGNNKSAKEINSSLDKLRQANLFKCISGGYYPLEYEHTNSTNINKPKQIDPAKQATLVKESESNLTKPKKVPIDPANPATWRRAYQASEVE